MACLLIATFDNFYETIAINNVTSTYLIIEGGDRAAPTRELIQKNNNYIIIMCIASLGT